MTPEEPERGDRPLDLEEVERRLVHAGGVVFPAAYLLGVVTWPQLRSIYVAGSALALVLEVLRLVVGIESRVFDRLTRAYEESNLAGYALYTFGSTAVVLAFEPLIAVPAVLMLVLVDPVSGLLSRNAFGEPKRPLVLAVTFALSVLLAIPFVRFVPALLAGIAVTVADGATPVIRGYVIDDNLTIPIGAGVAMWVGVEWLPAVG